ncbi:flagellar MS-ring protein, partial [Acetobacter malorum]
LRSQQTTSDKSVNTEANTNTSVANNLPNANANQDNKTGSTNDREEETNNYEIGKRTRVVNQTRPRVSRISLAVMVDGTVAPDKSGKEVWHPLDAAEIEHISTLAKTAIGYDRARGDEVQVVSMRFMADGGMSLAAGRDSLFSRDTLIYLAEWVVPIVLALGAIFIGLRPVLRRGGVQALVQAGQASTQLVAGAAPNGAARELTDPDGTPRLLSEDDGTVNVDGIEGKLRREAVQKVADRFEDNTEESVLIIRGWLEAAPAKKKEA